ncbi:hypothetical protein ACJ72_08492 [Emergomyces africanus]|uniref:Uncharacterized protein n=1 Tax=Emergomyces africanus TaxID=1955775 RepID=A0A1B7NKC4_9EURO|nr:hypothetical protein ACJ72_08492 [Emergomyces africanus]
MKVMNSHNYCLDTFSEIHNVFHTNLLHPAASDPFPSQKIDNYQPPGYNRPTWEPASALENTAALDTYDQSLPPTNAPALE